MLPKGFNNRLALAARQLEQFFGGNANLARVGYGQLDDVDGCRFSAEIRASSRPTLAA
jgi:hypothetical protein